MHFIATSLLFIALVCTIVMLMAWYREKNLVKHPDMFVKTSKNKIEKLITVRERLIKCGCSKKNEAETKRIINQLRYWMAQKTDTPSMAQFIKRQYNLLYFLLPGEASRSHNKMAEELKSLYLEASKYTN